MKWLIIICVLPLFLIQCAPTLLRYQVKSGVLVINKSEPTVYLATKDSKKGESVSLTGLNKGDTISYNAILKEFRYDSTLQYSYSFVYQNNNYIIDEPLAICRKRIGERYYQKPKPTDYTFARGDDKYYNVGIWVNIVNRNSKITSGGFGLRAWAIGLEFGGNGTRDLPKPDINSGVPHDDYYVTRYFSNWFYFDAQYHYEIIDDIIDLYVSLGAQFSSWNELAHSRVTGWSYLYTPEESNTKLNYGIGLQLLPIKYVTFGINWNSLNKFSVVIGYNQQLPWGYP